MARSLAEDIAIQASKLPWWVCFVLAYISYIVLDHFAINPGTQLDTTGVQIGTMGSFAVKYLYGYIAYFGKFVFPFIFTLAGIGSLLRSKKRSPFAKFAIITTTVVVGLAIFQATYNKLTEPLNIAISQQKEKQQGEPKSIEKSKPQKYTLYSWKEENGYRGYSNTSFPTDRPYSDPKIEYR